MLFQGYKHQLQLEELGQLAEVSEILIYSC